MDGGWYAGIWKELETAELVAGKHPKGTVVPMTKFASGVESEKRDTIDAERYRFLRDRDPVGFAFHALGLEVGRNPEDEIDAAIDAAIAKEKP
jgi:hypothetical protein